MIETGIDATGYRVKKSKTGTEQLYQDYGEINVYRHDGEIILEIVKTEKDGAMEAYGMRFPEADLEVLIVSLTELKI